MAVLTRPAASSHAVLGNITLYWFPFDSVADGDTFAVPEPNVILESWFASHHTDVVTLSHAIASGTATFQMSVTAPATLFVLGGSR